MNRQAKVAGTSVWHSYGAVTLAEAARLHAVSIHEFGRLNGNWQVDRDYEILTREEPEPGKESPEFQSTVSARISYSVHSHRDDATQD